MRPASHESSSSKAICDPIRNACLLELACADWRAGVGRGRFVSFLVFISGCLSNRKGARGHPYRSDKIGAAHTIPAKPAVNLGPVICDFGPTELNLPGTIETAARPNPPSQASYHVRLVAAAASLP